MAGRPLDLVVISDVHLGTYGCHASELHTYLKSIAPRVLVINGDFIDGWAFSKNYFPEAHWKVIRRLIKMMNEGTLVYYLTGNHDEFLRRFSGSRFGKLKLDDKLLLEHRGKMHWFFHGDIFDITMKHSKWLGKLGGKGYDYVILLNRAVNYVLEKMGREKISLSKRIKQSVKQAVKFIGDFEQTAADLAIEEGYEYVICGHIHQPVIRQYRNQKGSVIYMNPGDWIENLSALEFENNEWRLVSYHELGLTTSTTERLPKTEEEQDGAGEIPSLEKIAEVIHSFLITFSKQGAKEKFILRTK
jgi:UDP-2,3-diacylglucosamine pyrophosphatase LpxH